MAQKKIKVVVGDYMPEDLKSDDGMRLLIGKDTLVTRQMVEKLGNWIYEEEPSLPVKRKKIIPKEKKKDTILKKLEFEEIVSEITKKELETGINDFFNTIQKQDQKLDIDRLMDTIFNMVDDMPDTQDVPLRLFEIQKRANIILSHSSECGIIASFVASALNYPQETVSSFSLAMTLHDIGVMTLPLKVLEMNGIPNENLRRILKQHPKRGWDLLKEVPGVEPITQMIVLYHHVNADGSGYPDGIDFNDLHPLVHLSTIISNYESLISRRPYRRAYSMHDAIKLLLIHRDKYHPGALESFVKVVGVFPISTFVRLNTGEIGVVVRNNPENLFMPEIKLVMNPGGKPYSKEIIVNLLNESDREIVKVEEQI